MTREAVARARAMGQTNNGRVIEQVEEKLHQAERQEKEAATMDRTAKDLGERMQDLQERLNRHDQARRKHQGQVAEHVERVKREVANRRQEASRLKAMREELRKREEECGRERDRLNKESLSGEPARDRVKGDTTNKNPTRQTGKDHNKEDDPHHLDDSRSHTRHPEGVIAEVTRDNNNTQAGPSNPVTRKEDKGNGREHQGQHKRKRRLRSSTNSTGTAHHGVTKEAKGQQKGRPEEGQGEYQEDNAIGANHRAEKARSRTAGRKDERQGGGGRRGAGRKRGWAA